MLPSPFGIHRSTVSLVKINLRSLANLLKVDVYLHATKGKSDQLIGFHPFKFSSVFEGVDVAPIVVVPVCTCSSGERAIPSIPKCVAL
jgi:hypothetical protein